MNQILYWAILLIIAVIFALIYHVMLSTPDLASYILGMSYMFAANLLDVINKAIKKGQ